MGDARLRTGLIGDNISRTRLPAALDIMCRDAGIALTFEPIDTAGHAGFDLAACVAELRSAGWDGVAVTHPHKPAAAGLFDGPARRLGAANLLVFGTAPAAHNTDYTGFVSAWRALREQAAPGRVAMAGAGGVARAIATGLAGLGATEIAIWDIAPGRAAALAAEGADFLFRAVADDLAFRLSTVKRDFGRGILFVPQGAPPLPLEAAGTLVRHEAGDGGPVEALGLPEAQYDLAVSLLTLHETNDTPGVLAQIRRALKPDGLFLACVPAAGTLAELRDCLISAEAELTAAANARVLPFMDVRDAGGLLQRAGFALPVTDTETLTVRYDTMFNLMLDLRAMGATNTLASRSRSSARRGLFQRAAELYAARHADADGRVRATLQFVWMSGWAPHESQQKPLRPGSATASLADVLKDRSGGDGDGR